MREANSGRSGWGRGVSTVLLLGTTGAAIGLLVTGMSLRQASDRLFGGLARWFNAPAPAPEVAVESVVIQQMRDASELTTAVFTMQAVVPTQQDAAVNGFVFGTTKLLYIAQGNVKAGVDLSQLSTASVTTSGEQVTVQLPAPRILDSKIDVNRSKIYDYNRGFLGLGPDVGPELQTLAQKEALQSIEAAACQNGLLQQASDRAQLVVTQLLTTAGYKQVTVKAQAPAPNACSTPTGT